MACRREQDEDCAIEGGLFDGSSSSEEHGSKRVKSERMEDSLGPYGFHFTVKNLRGDELFFSMGDGLRTLADLRTKILQEWRVPKHEQRFVCQGRTFHGHYYEHHTLIELFGGSEELMACGPQEECVVHLLSLREDDFTAFGCGVFTREEFEAKRQLCERRNIPFEPISICTARRMFVGQLL